MPKGKAGCGKKKTARKGTVVPMMAKKKRKKA